MKASNALDVRRRGKAGRRGYDADWRQARDLYLAEHMVCERCRRQLSSLVHHRRPLREGGNRLDPANLEALCRKCHGLAHAAKALAGRK